MRRSQIRQEASASPDPTQLAEPPPRCGDLRDPDAARWVAAGVVGFGGFATAAEAARAAWIAHRTLERREAQALGAALLADPGPPAVVRRGGRDVVLAAGREIAALVSAPRDEGGGPHDAFGFELRLPPPADELHARAASYLIDRELRSAGLDCRLRPPRPLPRAS